MASAPESEGPLAIICGAGSLPFAVADAACRRGRGVVLFALRGWADPNLVASYPHYWVRFGQLGRFCRTAAREGCRDVVFIGSVVRPTLWQIWPDLAALRVAPRIIRMFQGGDDHLMSSLMKIFEDCGFRPVGAHEIAPEILMPEGAVGRLQPSESNRVDMALGLALLHAIGRFDVGQATVVAGGHVLAVEAAEGTDEMLAQLAELRRKGRIRSSGGVLVKAPKSGQDRRIDLPTIGPKTIAGAARAGLDGIAVVAGEAIIAEPERVAQAADRSRIFIVGTPPGRNPGKDP
ncbi:MAG TPA: UDP-2,3-diacylglucosamine diphosphatase LpxI [Xanthobacteraceae bacterium]